MIEYVIGENPDDRILKKASELLKQGELVCLPSDTHWILLADPFSKDSAMKLHKFKGVDPSKHFSAFCPSIKMASEVALINNQAFRILNKITPGAYTFIFEATKKLAKQIKATKRDKEIGIRIINSTLINRLLEVHGQILLGTSIHNSMLDVADADTIYSYQLEDFLRGTAQMIVDPGEFEFHGASSVISFKDEVPELVRQGEGDTSFLF